MLTQPTGSYRPSVIHRLWISTPLYGIVNHLISRIRNITEEWRAFRASFVLPSSLETKKRSRQHNKTRRISWPDLHYAAYRGRIYYVETLLQKNSVNMSDCEKVTPLHCAIMGGNPNMILSLIAAGADIHAADFRGQTPLYWAAYFGNSFAVQLLIKLRADVNRADRRGKTPLRAAVKYGSLSAAALLLASGANINVQDSKKQTPYFVASLHGRIAPMNLLRAFGADPWQVNVDGKTAYEVAGRASLWTYLRYKWQIKTEYQRLLNDQQIKTLYSLSVKRD